MGDTSFSNMRATRRSIHVVLYYLCWATQNLGLSRIPASTPKVLYKLECQLSRITQESYSRGLQNNCTAVHVRIQGRATVFSYRALWIPIVQQLLCQSFFENICDISIGVQWRFPQPVHATSHKGGERNKTPKARFPPGPNLSV